MLSLNRYSCTRRAFCSDGAAVVNFSENTLNWIISSTKEHMIENGHKYQFQKQNVRLLLPKPSKIHSLIPCTQQITSQWIINKMITDRYYVHAFANYSANFTFFKDKFKLSETAVEINSDSENTLTDKQNNCMIEKVEVNELTNGWIQKHDYFEYFDLIFDELPLENIVTIDLDSYVKTTIFGYALKKTGILYVIDKKIGGDISGAKLRQKIGNLYPNTHFELFAERDTACSTQFCFMKVDNCSNLNTDREINRTDHHGDTHFKYNQDRIYGTSPVIANAGDMKEGMDRMFDALGVKPEDGDGPKYS